MIITNDQLEELAIKVSTKINGTQVTRLIPKSIQDTIRSWTQGFPYKNQFVMPIGSGGIMVEITIDPDGSMHLELCDITHYRFWQAHLEASKDLNQIRER